MATAIVQIIASILSYLAVRGVDQVLSKWVAYFMIAWEKVATKNAIDVYTQTKQEMIIAMPEKWTDWEKWRDSLKKQ